MTIDEAARGEWLFMMCKFEATVWISEISTTYSHKAPCVPIHFRKFDMGTSYYRLMHVP